MILSVMQPYLFPYMGYFQLIHATDLFMIHDDVRWIKGGWINRNRILLNGSAGYITLPVEKGSSDDLINQKLLAHEWPRAARKIEAQIRQNYRQSTQYNEVMPLVQQCLETRDPLIGDLAVNSLRLVCGFLGIETPFRHVSELGLEPSLTGQPRVIEINMIVGATRYINPIGGRELYDAASFAAQGIELRFLQARATPYPQLGVDEFVPFLSIIDVLMNNPVERVQEMLGEYDLIES
jgi:hypothetical protein